MYIYIYIIYIYTTLNIIIFYSTTNRKSAMIFSFIHQNSLHYVPRIAVDVGNTVVKILGTLSSLTKVIILWKKIKTNLKISK